MLETSRVIRVHQASTTDPLIVSEGDELSVSNKTSEWPGWIWCTHSSGKSGWVAENYVQRAGNRGIMLRDYDATELTVDPGLEFSVLEKESGWAWCTDHKGMMGWLPLNCLELS